MTLGFEFVEELRVLSHLSFGGVNGDLMRRGRRPVFFFSRNGPNPILMHPVPSEHELMQFCPPRDPLTPQIV